MNRIDIFACPEYEVPLTLRFEVPIGLPYLGGEWRGSLMISGLRARVVIRQRRTPKEYQAEFGGMAFQGPGLVFHERDRFGVYSYSAVEITFTSNLRALFNLQLVGTVDVSGTPGAPAGAVLPFVPPECKEFVASIFNQLVDVHEVAYATPWLPRITGEDVFHLYLIQHQPDGSNETIASGMGVENRVWRFGMDERYPAEKPETLRAVFAALPLAFWEEVLLTVDRDAVVGRLRSAAMHLGLGFEMYVGELLARNGIAAQAGHRLPTLKPLCTKKGYLRELLGSALNDNRHACVLQDYESIAALRDTVMHQGQMTYSVTHHDGSEGDVEVSSYEDILAHREMVARLVRYIEREVIARGFFGVARIGVVWPK